MSHLYAATFSQDAAIQAAVIEWVSSPVEAIVAAAIHPNRDWPGDTRPVAGQLVLLRVEVPVQSLLDDPEQRWKLTNGAHGGMCYRGILPIGTEDMMMQSQQQHGIYQLSRASCPSLVSSLVFHSGGFRALTATPDAPAFTAVPDTTFYRPKGCLTKGKSVWYADLVAAVAVATQEAMAKTASEAGADPRAPEVEVLRLELDPAACARFLLHKLLVPKPSQMEVHCRLLYESQQEASAQAALRTAPGVRVNQARVRMELGFVSRFASTGQWIDVSGELKARKRQKLSAEIGRLQAELNNLANSAEVAAEIEAEEIGGLSSPSPG
jgi:hypothetical protein